MREFSPTCAAMQPIYRTSPSAYRMTTSTRCLGQNGAIGVLGLTAAFWSGQASCRYFTAAAICALLAACAQPPPPVQPLPPGPTPQEVADYSTALAQYRSGLASGNDDIVTQATNTFSLIAQEILSRQDPRLFDAWVVCQRYPADGPRDQRGLRSTYQPQFVEDCRRIDGRYNQETIAIRRDLDVRVAAADRATIAEAGVRHP
jgi:hypothetical protein